MAESLAARRRVALVTWEIGPPDAPIGGYLAKAIARGHDRFDFVVVSRTLPPELRPLVEWHRVRTPGRPFRLKWASFYALAGARLARVRADVVHTWGPAPIVPNHVDLCSANFIHAEYHRAADGRPPGTRALAWRAARAFTLGLERRAYAGGRVSLLDVDTEGAKAAMERHYPGVPVIVTGKGVDVDRYRPDPEARGAVRREHGAGEDDVVALFAGRDWHAKGLEQAIAGFAEARRRGARGLVLWVAGRDDTPALMRIARRHGVADRVVSLGFAERLETICAAADLLLLPTLVETFSRIAHEAAATELPVVGTAVHGVRELIGADEAGIVVERDAGSIADALVRLAADPELRARMGRAGRERCVPLAADRPAERWLELYERI